jgi:hypothetical protein
MIFTSEHKRFFIESYFVMVFSSTDNEHTAPVVCLAEFRQNLKNFAFLEADFLSGLRNTVITYTLARHRLTRRQAVERGVFQFVNKQCRI